MAVKILAVGDVCGEALSAKNSRYHETQADDYGYDFLKKCGKNPWAMGLAFKKLMPKSRASSMKMCFFIVKSDVCLKGFKDRQNNDTPPLIKKELQIL